jgi:hypothetical protein
MSHRVLLLSCWLVIGCSSQFPNLRVDDQQAMRIGVADRERLRNTDGRERVRAREELERARLELPRAEELARAVVAERKATQDPRLVRVLDAKAEWAQARVAWRAVEVEHASRREAAALAKEELDKAEIVSRMGVDLEVERFHEQYARAHEAWSRCSARLAAAHATADAADGHLAAAKSQYARDRLFAMQPAH